jgi:hypothetical protein
MCFFHPFYRLSYHHVAVTVTLKSRNNRWCKYQRKNNRETYTTGQHNREWWPEASVTK